MNQNNPFIAAKRQVTRPSTVYATGKYAHYFLPKYSIDALKEIYAASTNRGEKSAITRAINERLGLKVIRSTPAQERAKAINYALMVLGSTKAQTLKAFQMLQEADPASILLAYLHSVYSRVFYVDNLLRSTIKNEAKPETPRSKKERIAAWKKVTPSK